MKKHFDLARRLDSCAILGSTLKYLNLELLGLYILGTVIIKERRVKIKGRPGSGGAGD